MRHINPGYVVMYSDGSHVQKEEFAEFFEALESYALHTAQKNRTVLLVDPDADEIIREFHYGSGGDHVSVTPINE